MYIKIDCACIGVIFDSTLVLYIILLTLDGAGLKTHARKIKATLFLAASLRTIRRCIRKLGWKKIQTSNCQIVSPINRIKRFVYANILKKYLNRFFLNLFKLKLFTIYLLI
jgi:hypothetical protein